MKSTPAPLWPTFLSKLIGNLLYVLSSARPCDGIVRRVPIDTPRPTNFVIVINILLCVEFALARPNRYVRAIERVHSVLTVAAKTSLWTKRAIRQTDSNNLPTTPGAYQTIYGGGGGDGFVAKFNASGSVVYSTYLGGSGGDTATAIAVDQAGSAYVTGNNLNGGFPLKDALQTNPNIPSFEGFVTKLAPDGASLMYSTYLGGASNDLGLGIAVDLLGSAYVGGVTASPDFPTTPGAYQQTNAGGYDGFVVKIAAASAGKITGGGSIAVANNIGTFGFIVQREKADAPIRGDLQYVDNATGVKVHSVTFNSFSVNGSGATFSGTCVNSGVPCTFTVAVTDNGEPGTNDIFSISISGGPMEGGTLRSGNIQIH